MIDSHAHVMFDTFAPDRPAVVKRARAAGVKWIEIGTDIDSSKKAVAFAQKHEGVWATVGVHPSDYAELSEAGWQELEQLLQHDKVMAVGEVGLDFYRGGQLEEQLPILKRFLDLATKHHLPVVFHVRDGKESAHEPMIMFLHSLAREQRPRGVMHTFSGNQTQAYAYLDLGMYLSFSGVVTFKNSGVVADIARTMPLERALIETDCPFLAPEPYRGKRNEPAYLTYVASKIAALRQIPTAEVERITEENTRSLFKLAT
ncbi:MAG: TatD family hydrolase [Candidatus Andersenbacteria bacterium]